MTTEFQDAIDGDTLAAEVVMLRAASAKTIMLVEGADDDKLFSEFIDEENCELVICHGKENALNANSKIEQLQIGGVICVIDSDFSIFLEGNVQSENVIHTDDHDIEIMLFRSRAFNRVTRELASAPKLKKLRDERIDPREPIWKAARYVGILRLCSVQLGINLKFEDMKFTLGTIPLRQVDGRFAVVHSANSMRGIVVCRHQFEKSMSCE